MDFNIPPVGGSERAGPSQRSASAQQADFAPALDAAVNLNTLPASPPASVLEEMHAAARVADKLLALGRELHFEPNSNGRMVVQVRDLDGNVLRTVPPSTALEIAGGAPLDS